MHRCFSSLQRYKIIAKVIQMRPKKLPKCIILPSEMYSDTLKTLSKTCGERNYIKGIYLCRQK